MADTLGEIFNGTLTESDFVNGEATIVTTDANTSLVIKDMKVVQGSNQVPVVGDLKVGNFTIASVTSDASGTEIIGPNSTLKVTSTSFPPAYTDLVFQFQESANIIKNKIFPKIGGLDAGPAETTTTNISSLPYKSTDYPARQIFTGIGPDNHTVVIFDDNNSQTLIYIYEASGAAVYSDTTNYTPKWFDGTRYAYWFPSGQYLYKLDTWTGIPVAILMPNTGTATTYAKMFGQAGQYAVFWPDYTGANAYYIDLVTDKIGRVTTNMTPNGMFGVAAKRMYLASLESGFKVVRNSNQNTLVVYDWAPGTLLTSAPSGLNVSLPVNIAQENEAQVLLGNTFYYADTSRNLQAFNLDTQEITNLGTLASSQVYGNDIWYKLVTPDSTTVSNRSYTFNPSLSLRLTGVTSTQG